jgi:hypothetical protein
MGPTLHQLTENWKANPKDQKYFPQARTEDVRSLTLKSPSTKGSSLFADKVSRNG